jgi:hypothetical protein
MTLPLNQDGPCSIELEHSLPSEVAAISPFVDELMLSIGKCGYVPEGLSQTRSFTGIMRILENPSMFVSAIGAMEFQSW